MPLEGSSFPAQGQPPRYPCDEPGKGRGPGSLLPTLWAEGRETTHPRESLRQPLSPEITALSSVQNGNTANV